MQTDSPKVSNINSPGIADTTVVEFEANDIQDQSTHKCHHTETGTDGSPAKCKKESSKANIMEGDQE